METIRGYSRRDRTITAAVFLPLSALVSILAIVCDPQHVAGPVGAFVISLLLLTPLWRAFYPLMLVMLGLGFLWRAAQSGRGIFEWWMGPYCWLYTYLTLSGARLALSDVDSSEPCSRISGLG